MGPPKVERLAILAATLLSPFTHPSAGAADIFLPATLLVLVFQAADRPGLADKPAEARLGKGAGGVDGPEFPQLANILDVGLAGSSWREGDHGQLVSPQQVFGVALGGVTVGAAGGLLSWLGFRAAVVVIRGRGLFGEAILLCGPLQLAAGVRPGLHREFDVAKLLQGVRPLRQEWEKGRVSAEFTSRPRRRRFQQQGSSGRPKSTCLLAWRKNAFPSSQSITLPDLGRDVRLPVQTLLRRESLVSPSWPDL